MQRYRPIVRQWDAFARAAERPEPTTLRVNTARTSVPRLRASLEKAGFRLETVEGLPTFLRVAEEPFPLSATLEHWLGLFYMQQAVTGVAPLALGARPGERILDLCAAPGGKASHLAGLLEGRGVVVAGENDERRIRGLLGNLYRLGEPGVLVVSADGRNFPGGVLFDRTLVDVPCSGEGNLRRRGGAIPSRADSFRAHIAGVQRALLRRAVELTRPGGTILYVTCTFAPEENEMVVARALSRLPVTLEPIDLDVPHEPGLTRHGERTFPSELAHAWRLYPHHLDSGGLFMARLRRGEGNAPGAAPVADGDGWSVPPAAYPEEAGAREEGHRAIQEGLSRLHEQMGVPLETLDAVHWMLRGDSVWMHRCPEWPVDAWERSGEAGSPPEWRLVSAGMRAFRGESGGRFRATNDLLRWLDGSLRDRVVSLDRSRCLRLLEAGELPAEGGWDGYVALRLEGRVIGRGWMRAGRLRPEIPKAQRRPLLALLRAAAERGRGEAG